MKKVVVGMSGGVDSSVTALLLQKEGYEVIGLFMRNWDSSINNDINGNPTLNNNICPQEQDYLDALSVCDKLNIVLHRVDFVKEYWDNVFTYFIDELKKGRTPNPDVMCNKYIKFDVFIKEAMKLGADYVATGHYAKVKDGVLYKAVDTNKDQTYFLSYLKENQLEKVMFPLGEYNKDEIRALALEYDLSVAKKKDSTGICFIGERNFKEFLTNYLPNQDGNIIDINTKEKVGRHNGLMYYTIGQRKGLNLSGFKRPYFSVGKNIDKNILYVSDENEDSYLNSNMCILEDLNLINDRVEASVSVKMRYRSEDIDATIEYLDNNEAIVRYDKAKAVTPGQVCVIYKNDVCLGAGIIKEVFNDENKICFY